MRFIITLLLSIILTSFLEANTVKVLFIGNSYTNSNNLPQTLANLAESLGDTVFHDKQTQGGATFSIHAANSAVYHQIRSDDWDFVVLQAQSQEPAFPPSQVANETYPYAAQLNDSIQAHNECTETLFFMTWGRRDGDLSNCAAYPPICTYEGMQQRLRESYLEMAEDNSATVAPVGVAWKNIRANYPNIDLYNNDGSHPSTLGTYLAASVFYSAIFQKPSITSEFISTIDSMDAEILRQIASNTVLDSLSVWRINANRATADFDFVVDTSHVAFQNQANNWDSIVWNFGDGNTSVEENPAHTYGSTGTYNITQIAFNNCSSDTVVKSVVIEIPVDTVPTNLNIEAVFSSAVFPNPSLGILKIKTKNNLQNFKVKMFSMEGKEVFPEEFAREQNSISFDVRRLENGIYYLLFENSGQRKVMQFSVLK